MTLAPADGQATSPGVDGSITRRRRWLVFLAVALTLVLVLVAGLYWRWRENPLELNAAHGVGVSGPVVVGVPLYANADIDPKASRSGHRVLDLRRVSPRLTDNSARATVTVLTCRVADPHLGVGMGPDTAPCAVVSRFRPGRVDLGFPATEIIFRITAARAGTVHISGTDVAYSVGGRNGTQHVGSDIVVHAAAPH